MNKRIYFVNARKIRFANRKLDVVRLNSHNSLVHELKKAEICYQLQKDGHHYITEAIFEDKSGIADIYDVTDDVVYEILNSETEAQCDLKNYPVKEIYKV